MEWSTTTLRRRARLAIRNGGVDVAAEEELARRQQRTRGEARILTGPQLHSWIRHSAYRSLDPRNAPALPMRQVHWISEHPLRYRDASVSWSYVLLKAEEDEQPQGWTPPFQLRDFFGCLAHSAHWMRNLGWEESASLIVWSVWHGYEGELPTRLSRPICG